ncbi:hypothetical protein [Gaetbulibacter aestuarii]|uniref:Uncharacterized protein n=1 Tax=Gaetbulibacter aestuarii TaxID=1502358 RepID=A0ABW7N2I8_9FLAO
MKLKLFAICFLFTVGVATAQEDFQVMKQKLPYHKVASSFGVNLIGVNEDFVIYNWQKFIESHGGVTYVVSIDRGNIELDSEHVVCPFLAHQKADIHSRITPNDDLTGVLLTIWIEKSNGTYYSSESDENSGVHINNWLEAFHNKLMALSRTH